MKDISGFAPIAEHSARLLILGSMPSEASLLKQQYYAHQRNVFWPVILQSLNQQLVCDQTAYLQRKELLIKHKIALWDVLQHCSRAGSLDSAIKMSSIKTNDFQSFFKAHKAITKVCFNGAKAEAIYMQRVFPDLDQATKGIQYIRLPSTSPAHAAMSFQQKLAIWKYSLVDDHV